MGAWPKVKPGRWALLALLLAGCGAGEAATPLPTLTLIPVTVTPTVRPVTPTPSATASTLLNPADVLTRLPTAASEPDAEAEGDEVEAVLDSDPIAAQLVALAQARLARQLDLATQRVRLVELTAYTWTESSLGCPLDGQTYGQVNIPGYRIVLAVAEDDEYIFHTDSTQLIACEPANEVLPEAEDR